MLLAIYIVTLALAQTPAEVRSFASSQIEVVLKLNELPDGKTVEDLSLGEPYLVPVIDKAGLERIVNERITDPMVLALFTHHSFPVYVDGECFGHFWVTPHPYTEEYVVGLISGPSGLACESARIRAAFELTDQHILIEFIARPIREYLVVFPDGEIFVVKGLRDLAPVDERVDEWIKEIKAQLEG